MTFNVISIVLVLRVYLSQLASGQKSFDPVFWVMMPRRLVIFIRFQKSKLPPSTLKMEPPSTLKMEQ